MAHKLMSDKEVSEYTGLSLWTINDLRRKQKIPYIQIPGIRRFFFDKTEIDRWLNSLQRREKAAQ